MITIIKNGEVYSPEIQLSDLLLCGITTVVGCLGTDGVCRDIKALLAKARALDEEGIRTYIYTNSYLEKIEYASSCKRYEQVH